MKNSLLNLLGAAALAVTTQIASAQIPADSRAELVDFALKNFWGNAIDSKGQPIQPTSESDRATVPIAANWVALAIDTGEVSGVLMWCALDPNVTMRALTARARSEGMTDKQVAFATVLHGITQGTVFRQRSSRQCTDNERTEAQRNAARTLQRLADRAA